MSSISGGIVSEPLRGFTFQSAGVHLDTAIILPDTEQGPDREPSLARSAFDWRGTWNSSCTPLCARGRCEPGTARGPVVVSRCTLCQMRANLLSTPNRISTLGINGKANGHPVSRRGALFSAD